MAKRFTMWHRVTGGSAQTTEAAYEQIWKPKGWRKSPPKKTDEPATEAGSTVEEEH